MIDVPDPEEPRFQDSLSGLLQSWFWVFLAVAVLIIFMLSRGRI